MADWQIRVIEERASLNTKLAALSAFISAGSSSFNDLPAEDQEILRGQYHAMLDYSDALEARVSRFGELNNG